MGRFLAVAGLGLVLVTPAAIAGDPTTAASSGFDAYVHGVESRLGRQHSSREGFLAQPGRGDAERLGRGELVIEHLTPTAGADLPGALLEDWRGTVFVAGARAEDFERLMRDFEAYPQIFSPQVERAKVVSHEGDRLQAAMRVRQKHVITVVMDANYDITFGRLDAGHGYSLSRSEGIREIAEPGTENEHALTAAEEHGFLWRLNTYWSYEQRDGGVEIQVETISLSRSIPAGFGWLLRPYVESVPRESLEFTLKCAADAMRKQKS